MEKPQGKNATDIIKIVLISYKINQTFIAHPIKEIKFLSPTSRSKKICGLPTPQPHPNFPEIKLLYVLNFLKEREFATYVICYPVNNIKF